MEYELLSADEAVRSCEEFRNVASSIQSVWSGFDLTHLSHAVLGLLSLFAARANRWLFLRYEILV